MMVGDTGGDAGRGPTDRGVRGPDAAVRRLALDMLDETPEDWNLSARPVVADSGYGDATAFRFGLAERGLSSVVAVKPGTCPQPG
ncbi:hypothetical protein JOF55_003231 [Haloactinomyces albus]|uniref:Transposase IS701-like DDE domain-containing protein n=1 Tax=Haloactinomyces albus TaxID=1352928 RepID=A0AAE3ZFY6_9ACTN|nr:transposase [Haloactinomyces albus]MDR7303050.1 hypothetical protein [Haloactinomyces albus]